MDTDVATATAMETVEPVQATTTTLAALTGVQEMDVSLDTPVEKKDRVINLISNDGVGCTVSKAALVAQSKMMANALEHDEEVVDLPIRDSFCTGDVLKRVVEFIKYEADSKAPLVKDQLPTSVVNGQKVETSLPEWHVAFLKQPAELFERFPHLQKLMLVAHYLDMPILLHITGMMVAQDTLSARGVGGQAALLRYLGLPADTDVKKLSPFLKKSNSSFSASAAATPAPGPAGSPLSESTQS